MQSSNSTILRQNSSSSINIPKSLSNLSILTSPKSPALNNNMPSQYVAGSGLSQISYLALNQFLTRGVTFLMNLFVARSVGPVIFGLQAIHLYLLNAIILFVAREAGRKATIRFSANPLLYSSSDSSSKPALPKDALETRVVVNLSWFCIGLGCIVTFVLTGWFHWSAPSEAIPLGYVKCLYIYALATIIEMMFEPLYVIATRKLLVKARLWIDSAATFVRCIVTVVAILFFDQQLMAFAWGQLAFSTFYSGAFYAYFLYEIYGNPAQRSALGVTSARQLFPQPIPSSLRTVSSNVATKKSLVQSTLKPLITPWIDWDLFGLYGWMLFQMIEKLALTEGEKAVMVVFSFSLDQQGVYGLIANLGSLVARLLFQPIEEASATEFSLLFASLPAHSDKSTAALPTPSGERGASPQPQLSARAAVYESAAHYLGVLLKLLALISMLLLSFGPNYSYVFIDLFYGAKWSLTDAPRVLSCYCIYISFLALNGLTEAFVTSVTTADQMKLYNALLLLFSVIYLSACAILLRFGAIGLIVANSINMSCRIIYSLVYIAKFFNRANDDQAASKTPTNKQKSYLSNIIEHSSPHLTTMLVFLISHAVTYLSFITTDVTSAGKSNVFVRYGMHISVGVACVAAVGSIIWRKERGFCSDLYNLVGARRTAKAR